MKWNVILSGVLAVLALSCGCGPKFCQVCQRAECQGLTFQVVLENGRTVETCCPRCGLHYLKVNAVRARSLRATDYGSGRWIDATRAVYVSGSDVSHCGGEETRRDAYGCCAFKDFDRCLPSLIAFATPQEAREFQGKHGGQIVSWTELARP